MNRRTKHIALIAGIPALTIMLFVASTFYHNSKKVVDVRVKIDAQPDNMFLNIQDVSELLSLRTQVLNQPVKSVNLQKLEKELMATQYVDTVNAYFGAEGLLKMNIKLRKPIVRIMPTGVEGYYLDEKGQLIPLSNTFTARVPILSGAVPEMNEAGSPKDTVLTQLLPMLQYIAQNSFWKANVSELYRDTNGDITLYPTMGNTPILFGTENNHTKKFNYLINFYKKVLNKRGWRYYKSIAVKYDGQVVATKK